MAGYTAFLDANILYPAPVRDIFLQLALTNLFRVRWSEDVHREWMDNLLVKRPDLSQIQLNKTRDLMIGAVPDSMVTGYHSFINQLTLPDPNDRHVLAAAIVGRCDVVVTANLKDFPENILRQYNIEAQHPDEFLSNHLDLEQGLFLQAVKTVRARLKNPPMDIEAYLQNLTEVGLVAISARLKEYADLL